MTVTVAEEDGRHRALIGTVPCCEPGHQDAEEAARHAWKLTRAITRKSATGRPVAAVRPIEVPPAALPVEVPRVAKQRQGRKCTATRSTDGLPCEGYAMNGALVCHAHGGRAAQVRASSRSKVAEDKAERLLYRYGTVPCDDPLEALRLLAGRVLAMEQAIGDMVNDLGASIRFTDDRGAEQLRSEVAVLERAMDRAGKLLVDIAKLNIDDRLAKVTERQADLAESALLAVLAEMGMDDAQQSDACGRLHRHLSAVA